MTGTGGPGELVPAGMARARMDGAARIAAAATGAPHR